MPRTACVSRRAFTLVELIGVIVIILILIAILVPVLDSALKFGAQTAARSEISQLDVSIAAARRDLGYGGIDLPYLPSALVLCDNWSNYSWTTATAPAGTPTMIIDLLSPSQQFLQKMFGKNIGQSGSGHLSGNLDWNGNGVVDGPILLLGDQVLTFYLGGIPSVSATGNAVTGFASNPADPTMPAGMSGAGNRKGPYYDFANTRLVSQWGNTQFLLSTGTLSSTNGFLMYLDYYKKQPLIYLSGYGGLGYNNYISTNCPTPSPLTSLVGPQLYSDINQFGGYGLLVPYCWTPATSLSLTVSNVSNTANPTITTSAAHGLRPGQIVVIAGVAGAVGVNGTWQVDEVLSTTTFTIPAPAPGGYTSSSGTVSLPTLLNPNTYQIITAGQDGLFGVGGLWNPATGYAPGTVPNPGADDLANFSKSPLGKPQS
jgi:type II secretory pathway pseudopilin PulG